MAFVRIPQKTVYGSQALTEMWEDEYGHYLFQLKKNGDDVWVMTPSYPTWRLTDENGHLQPMTQLGQVNGETRWRETNGWNLYYVPSMAKWVIIRNPPYEGYVPSTAATASTDPDTGTTTYEYQGDVWFECQTIDTMPYDGSDVGTFTLAAALSGSANLYPQLAPYANWTIHLVGTTYPAAVERTDGSGDGRSGPQGVYGDTFVGFPEWSYTWAGKTKYVSEYAYRNFTGLRRVSTRSVDDRNLTDRFTGWVAEDTIGPITVAPHGFYASLAQPPIESNFTLQWYHFVPDDPEDEESPGNMVHATSWIDDEGVEHQTPDITCTWLGVMGLARAHVSKARRTVRRSVTEAAIWR